MRYYLDTNILVFLWSGNDNEIVRDVKAIINDYGNILLTSSVCIVELLHLFHIGKLKYRTHGHSSTVANDVMAWLTSMGIGIVHTTDSHLRQFSALPLHSEEHRDPFDRFIVAQAIADRVPLVSSDRKFFLYIRDGLDLVFNKR